ncbi:MAG: ANTAR domain-containing protein [Clostridiales bacterium]|nr:ANTAR domain-containing protein [Clostridiales bacterium]
MINNASHSILLVSSSEKGVEAITKLIEQAGCASAYTVKNAGEARRILSVRHFDIIIINAPLSDEFGTELALQTSETSCSGIMMIAKSDISELIAAKTEDLGVVTVAKPIDRTLFHHTLKLLCVMQDKFAALENENKKLKMKLDEIKLVQRAKKVLMECLKMSEPQAHRYIEKQAMDMRITRYEVANSIIKTYTDTY